MSLLDTLFRRYSATRCIYGAAFCLVLPSVGGAQINMSGGTLTVNNMVKPRVQLTPAVTTIASKQTSVSIEIANPTTEPIVVTLSVGARNSRRAPGLSIGAGTINPNNARGRRLLAEGETLTKVNSLPEDSALVGWITDLPTTITLRPGEKKSITMKVSVPVDAKPGLYAAWILAATPVPVTDTAKNSQGGSVKVVPNPGRRGADSVAKPEGALKMMQVGVKLIHRVENPQ